MNKFKLQLLIAKAKEANAARLAAEAMETAKKLDDMADRLEADEKADAESVELDALDTEQQGFIEDGGETTPINPQDDGPFYDPVEQVEHQETIPDVAQIQDAAMAESPADFPLDSLADPVVVGSLALGDSKPAVDERIPSPKVESPQSGSASSVASLGFGAASKQQSPGIGNVFTESGSFHPVIPGFDYNEKQLQAIELAMRGKSINLIGAAGTGKTTTTREIIGQVVKLPQCTLLTPGADRLR